MLNPFNIDHWALKTVNLLLIGIYLGLPFYVFVGLVCTCLKGTENCNFWERLNLLNFWHSWESDFLLSITLYYPIHSFI